MGFAVLADLKAQLNIPASDTSNDTELTLYLNASNEVAESLVGKSADTTFTEIRSTVDGSIILNQRPLISVTSVTPYNGTVLGTVLPATAYLVDVNLGGLAIQVRLQAQARAARACGSWCADMRLHDGALQHRVLGVVEREFKHVAVLFKV